MLEADIDALLLDENEALADEVISSLRDAGIRYTRPNISSERVEIPLRQLDQAAEAVRIARALAEASQDGTRRFDVDRNDGQLKLTLTAAWKESLSRDAVERSLEVVRRRLDETGLVEPSITRQGSQGILVQMPGVADPGEIRELLGTTAKMSFHWAARAASEDNLATIVLPGAQDDQQYRLEKSVAMAGERIRDARMAFNPNTGQPVVNFKLDKNGARQFAEMTRNNIGRPLAIVLDGKVITAPVIRSEIGGSGEISGDFTTQEASELALLLRAGALPAPLDVLEERTVGPDLGNGGCGHPGGRLRGSVPDPVAGRAWRGRSHGHSG